MKFILKLIMLVSFLHIGALANEPKVTALLIKSGWVVDSVQGLYEDDTTTDTIGRAVSSYNVRYELDELAKITVIKSRLNGKTVIGQIVLT